MLKLKTLEGVEWIRTDSFVLECDAFLEFSL